MRSESPRWPTTSGNKLIYATGGCGGVCVFSYPQGTRVGELSTGYAVSGDCADSNGNIFITDDAKVLEYAHGGTQPIATLELPGKLATGCSIDSKTGNLAVVFSGTGANVAIFQSAQGTPTLYETKISSFYCGYDDAGNLFVSAFGQQPALTELRYGAKHFLILSIVGGKLGNPGQVQWDGMYITYEDSTIGHIMIARLSISGSTASIVSTTRFTGGIRNGSQSWIYGDRVFMPYSIREFRTNKIGVWPYPQGKKSLSKLKSGSTSAQFIGVTVSV